MNSTITVMQNEFIKKFYWLILTLIVSLFIFTISSSYHALQKISFHPLQYSFKYWNPILDSITTHTDRRLQEIYKLNTQVYENHSESQIYHEIMMNCISLDNSIRAQLAVLEILMSETIEIKEDPFVWKVYDRIIRLQEILISELNVLEKLGDCALERMNHKKKMIETTSIQEYHICQNKYNAALFKLNYPAVSGELQKISFVFFKLLIAFVLFGLSMAIIYFIGAFLLPAGIEMWEEKRKEKKQKGKK